MEIEVVSDSPFLRGNKGTGAGAGLRPSAAAIILLAAALLLPAVRTAAQNTWKYTNNPDAWSNATEWSLGVVPDGSTDISIGLGTVNDDTSFTNNNTLLIGSAATLNLLSGTVITNAPAGIIQNFGTLQGPGAIANSGLLENAGTYTGSSITNVGALSNTGTARFDAVNNNTGGSLDNAGQLTVLGSVNNEAGAILSNEAVFTLESITNYSGATLNNNGGVMQVLGTMTNAGALNNAAVAILTLDTGTPFTNTADGTINNAGQLTGGPLLNYGKASNSGTGSMEFFGLNNNTGASLDNSGRLTIVGLANNQAGASLKNDGGQMQVSGSFTNGGIVGNTGNLQFNNGIDNQTAGSITNSGTLTSNWFDTNDVGAVINNSGTANFYKLTNSGLLSNVGSMSFTALTNESGSTLNNDAGSLQTGSFTNAGTVHNAAGASLTITGSGVSTNAVGGVITNAGLFIGGGSPLTNNGSVANSGSMQLQEIDNNAGASLDNSGVLTSTGGLLYNAAGATVSNAGIMNVAYKLDNAGLLNNSGTLNANILVSISGGTLNNNAGTVQVSDYLDNENNGSVTNTGAMAIQQLTNELGGTLSNNAGTMQIDSSTIPSSNAGNFFNKAGATVTVATGATLVNSLLISNTGTFINNGTLENQAGGNIQNFGTFANNSTLQNDSGGKIVMFNTLENNQLLQNSGTLQVGAGLNAGTLNNSGTILNSNGGLISVVGGGTFNNSGELASDAQSYFTTAANSTIVNTGTMLFTVNPVTIAGTLRNDGVINMNGQVVPIPIAVPPLTVASTATLSGTGIVYGNVLTQGTMAPGDPTGRFTIYGNFTESGSAATLLENITGAGQNGELAVNGDVFLTGTLDVNLLNGFVPESDQTWVLMQYTGGLSGAFATDIFPEDGFDWSVVYDAADHEVLLDLRGVSGGSGGSGGGAGMATPEPGTLILMAAGAAMLSLLQKIKKTEEAA
jgi:hypothetical protein